MLLVRSEDDILSQAPIKLRFGSEDYDVKPLRILAARKWREKLIAQVKDISREMQVEAENMNVFLSSLAFIFLQFPEKMSDLVFDYAKDLPADKVLEEATEEQLSRAFGIIVQVAFPFTGELQTISKTLGVAASFPHLGKSTKSPSANGDAPPNT